MDAYNEIQIEIQRLRDIRASFVIHTDRHRMLASNLDAMIETFSRSSNALNDIVSYRERKWQEYADGISYNEVKRLRITKEQIFSLFRDPRMGEISDVRKAHIPIEWCTYQPFIDNWMDRWYMVFDHSPHNNREMPLYFLRKMYAEFVLGKHVNYFDILEFQGVGLGMPQQCPNARHIDPIAQSLHLRGSYLGRMCLLELGWSHKHMSLSCVWHRQLFTKVFMCRVWTKQGHQSQ